YADPVHGFPASVAPTPINRSSLSVATHAAGVALGVNVYVAVPPAGVFVAVTVLVNVIVEPPGVFVGGEVCVSVGLPAAGVYVDVGVKDTVGVEVNVTPSSAGYSSG
ncbi:MAG: hypothetical protein ACLQO7_08785, partial [Candidatus Bathyarchaeia archaeon]